MERVIKVKKRKTADETLKDISNYDSSHFKFLNINGEDKDVARLDMLYETMEKNGISGFVVKTSYLDYANQNKGTYYQTVTLDDITNDLGTVYGTDFKNGTSYYLQRENESLFLSERTHGQFYSAVGMIMSVEALNEYVAFNGMDFEDIELLQNLGQDKLKSVFESYKDVFSSLNKDFLNDAIRQVNTVCLKDASMLVSNELSVDKNYVEACISDPQKRVEMISDNIFNKSKLSKETAKILIEYHSREILTQANNYMIREKLNYNPVAVELPKNASSWNLCKIDAVKLKQPENHTVWTVYNTQRDLMNHGVYDLNKSEAVVLMDKSRTYSNLEDSILSEIEMPELNIENQSKEDISLE